MKNTEVRSVGRPKAELQYPRGIFTVQDLYELNRGPRGKGKRPQVCQLTVRKHIDAQLAAGFLTKVESLKTGKVGKPANQFIRTAVKAGLENARAARNPVNETPIPVDAPVAVEVPVSEPAVEVPAVAEVAGSVS